MNIVVYLHLKIINLGTNTVPGIYLYIYYNVRYITFFKLINLSWSNLFSLLY